MAKESIKDRWFSCVTYCGEPVVKKLIEKKGQYIRAWAYCIHDKDDTDPHIHVLLRTYQSYTYKAIVNWFDDCRESVDCSNTFVQKIIDKSAAVDYLTHRHEPDKTHYDEDNVVAQNLNDFLELGQAHDKSYEIIQDLLNGLSFRSLSYKYGRDFIYHYKAYIEVVKSIQLQERKEKNNINFQANGYIGENDYDVPMFESLLKDTIK